MIAKKLTIEFNAIKSLVREVYIAVGLITDEKFDFFIRNLPEESNAYIITGIHLPTSPSVLKKIRAAEGVFGKVYTKKFFHPKLYLFKLEDNWLAYVGSGNFTNGGWHENEELFFKITDEVTCGDLKAKFDSWFDEAIDISDKFLEIYEQTFNSNQPKQKEQKANISQMLDFLNHRFNINNIDFTGQFFQKQHHLAFEPGKTHLETNEILVERGNVRTRLYDLNKLLVTQIPENWDIHPHYENEHIVAHIENNFHHDYNVKALWVAYGRNKEELKKYGDWATPLQFMRMQVIIHYNDIGIWLMPGKQGAGQIDREYFAQQMNDLAYRTNFFNLLQDLGEDYWIEIAGVRCVVTAFDTVDSLWTFTKTDRWRDYYFIIGKDYPLGSEPTKENNIIQNVIGTFHKYLPIYNLMLHRGV
jgi:HKD family nuclease